MRADRPPVPPPETKNWTWVLDRPCPECGYDAARLDLASVAGVIDGIARRWEAVLARPDAADRPRPDVWSPLEYGCHVRDTFRIFDHRLRRMQLDDTPTFEDWDPDAWAALDRYDAQDAGAVARVLRAQADAFAVTVGASTDRTRRGVRSDGAVFTVESLVRYLVHDPWHHLADVGG